MRKLVAILLALALVVLAAPPAWSGQQAVPLLSAETGLVPAAVPFQQGEEVRYEVNWKPLFLFPAFKAGEVRLTVETTRYQERDAYKISAWASSDGLLKSVAGLDVRDYFESITDGLSFRSQRFVQQTRQNQRRRDLEVVMDYSQNRTTIREFDVSVDPPRQIRSEVRDSLPPDVADTLSVFYAARLRKMMPGDQYLVHLSDNGKIQDIQLRVVAKENVKTDLGRFETVKITTQGGIFREGGDFRIWYTLDNLRVPVKFEADVKFGKIYGQLVHIRTPQFSKSLVRIQE